MENALEEYEVNTKKWEEQLKNTSRKFQELQKKYYFSYLYRHTTFETERKTMLNKMNKLEQEK